MFLFIYLFMFLFIYLCFYLFLYGSLSCPRTADESKKRFVVSCPTFVPLAIVSNQKINGPVGFTLLFACSFYWSSFEV